MPNQFFQGTDREVYVAEPGRIEIHMGNWFEEDGKTPLSEWVSGDGPAYLQISTALVPSVYWNNQATPAKIKTTLPLPPDIDTSTTPKFYMMAGQSGTTDSPTMTLVCHFGREGQWDVADDAGGTTTAGDFTGSSPIAVYDKLSIDLDASKILDNDGWIELALQPTDGTIGTDSILLVAAWIEYAKNQSMYFCRVLVPYAHKLVNAWAYFQNVVTTGTVEVKLRRTSEGFNKGGAQLGDTLENEDLEDHSDICKPFKFDLLPQDKGVVGANTIYFLSMTGTDLADRLEAPLLLVEVEPI